MTKIKVCDQVSFVFAIHCYIKQKVNYLQYIQAKLIISIQGFQFNHYIQSCHVNHTIELLYTE